jgi:hypothetical protein
MSRRCAFDARRCRRAPNAPKPNGCARSHACYTLALPYRVHIHRCADGPSCISSGTNGTTSDFCGWDCCSRGKGSGADKADGCAAGRGSWCGRVGGGGHGGTTATGGGTDVGTCRRETICLGPLWGERLASWTGLNRGSRLNAWKRERRWFWLPITDGWVRAK